MYRRKLIEQTEKEERVAELVYDKYDEVERVIEDTLEDLKGLKLDKVWKVIVLLESLRTDLAEVFSKAEVVDIFGDSVEELRGVFRAFKAEVERFQRVLRNMLYDYEVVLEFLKERMGW